MEKTCGGYVVKAVWTQSHETAGKRYNIVKYYPISIRSNSEFNAIIPNEIVYST
jgi:CTP-dependent riboflavin kinase